MDWIASGPGGLAKLLLIPRHGRLLTGFDGKMLDIEARGRTVREIQAILTEPYATEVSPEFITSVTDAVMGEVTAGQARPLAPMYPVMSFDALRVKLRKEGVVCAKAIYLALSEPTDGSRDRSWHFWTKVN